jgi:enamine deaminase RidA (YjgF/YER057c/UK114 family)
MNYNPEERIKELGLVLPPAPKPVGIYKPVLVSGNLLYVSGQGPVKLDGSLMTGKVGSEITLEEGKLAARQVGLTMIAIIKEHFGDLNRIKRLIKTLGMVNCLHDFYSSPAVINGFSELMAELWGEENGIGVRSAVGMTLPSNIAAEVEAIFELKP